MNGKYILVLFLTFQISHSISPSKVFLDFITKIPTTNRSVNSDISRKALEHWKNIIRQKFSKESNNDMEEKIKIEQLLLLLENNLPELEHTRIKNLYPQSYTKMLKIKELIEKSDLNNPENMMEFYFLIQKI